MEVSDIMSIGCRCQGTNHYATLDKEGLERLITSLRELDKKSLKQYILGELAASMQLIVHTNFMLIILHVPIVK